MKKILNLTMTFAFLLIAITFIGVTASASQLFNNTALKHRFCPGPHLHVAATVPAPHLPKVVAIAPKPHLRKVIATAPKPHLRKVIATAPKPHHPKVAAAAPKPHHPKVVAAAPRPHLRKAIASAPGPHLRKVIAAAPKPHLPKVLTAAVVTPKPYNGKIYFVCKFSQKPMSGVHKVAGNARPLRLASSKPYMSPSKPVTFFHKSSMKFCKIVPKVHKRAAIVNKVFLKLHLTPVHSSMPKFLSPVVDAHNPLPKSAQPIVKTKTAHKKHKHKK